MKARLLHIIVLAVLASCVFSSCRKDEEKVIPRAKLARIYAEMLVTDQWITSTPGIRLIADTSLVYEPILEKYGYDSDDYRKSVDVYMNDPERFARILRTTGQILDKRIAELEEIQELEELRAALPKIEADFRPEEFFPYLFDEPYVHYYDSIAFEPDSVLWIYRLKSIERADTIYDQLRMIILDSLVVADSLAMKDSLSLKDSLALKDTLALKDSIILAEPIDVLKLKTASDTAASLKNKVMKKTIEDPMVRGRNRARNQKIIMDNAELEN